MALAPPGTRARRLQQRSLNDRVCAQQACPHTKPAIGRGGPHSTRYDYVCPDCGKTLRSYYWTRGAWQRMATDA